MKRMFIAIESLISWLMAIPVTLVLVIMNRFKPIRIGRIRSSRIGHFSYEPEHYLCETDRQPSKTKDIFFFDKLICNHQLALMWQRRLTVISGPLATMVFPKVLIILSKFSFTKNMILKITFPYKTHRLESLGETQPHLVFLEKEIERGRQALEMMGLNPDKPFVCIYARDSAYLEKMYPDRNWSYHDYRDQSIEDFRQAVLYLLEQGYSVIRMGKIVKDTFDVDHPDFIDYSNSKYCSDFLDIFLPAHCAFFVGSPSGLVSVPQIFRRPIAYVDFCCPRAFYYWDLNDSRAIFIWKKVFDKVEKRILTFAETIQYNMPESLTNPDMPLPHDRSRYQIVNNSANEIMKLCEEMHLRLNDQWSLTDDHDLQKQLKDLYPNNVADDLKFNRMGYAFIKEHAHLMNADHPVSTTS